jgi:hypothetical protein
MFVAKPFALFAALLLATVAACGSDADPGADAGGDEEDWTMLIESSWTIPAGSEVYQCERLTVTEDIYVSSFDAIGPLGTHHTVLTMGEPNGPDGPFPCNVGTNADAAIFGSGVGPATLEMPAGVATKIAAGQQLLINLHLFNASDEPLSGVSGTRIQTVDPSEVSMIAESVLMGRVSLSVPTGETIQTGTCAMNGDVTVFAVSPHMHQLGTHMKVEHGTTVLHDESFSFTEQTNWPIEPGYQMPASSQLKVTCTWHNTTGDEIPFGDSSDEEMCFVGFYRYPKTNANLYCIF